MPVTVKDLIDELGITVGEDDIVEPAMDHVLVKGDELQVKRVTTDYVTEEVTTDYEVRYVNDYSLAHRRQRSNAARRRRKNKKYLSCDLYRRR